MVQLTNSCTLARTRGQCHRRATPPAPVGRDGKTTKRDNRQTSTTTDKDNNSKHNKQAHNSKHNKQQHTQQRDNTQCQYISYTKLTVRGTVQPLQQRHKCYKEHTTVMV